MNITIKINEQIVQPCGSDAALNSTLHEILAGLVELRGAVRHLVTTEGAEHMVSAAVKAVVDAMNVATDKIGERIQTLIDRVNAGTPLSAEDTALLQGEVDRLTALGKDPENPVPVEDPGPVDPGQG